MSDDEISARLAAYLGRYATFPMPDGDARSRGAARRTAIGQALTGGTLRGIGGTILALAIAAALIVVLGVGLGLRSRTQTALQPPGSTLFGGPPATGVPAPRDNFVWFTGTASVTVGPVPASQGGSAPATGSQPGVSATGLRVAVLDWTGAVRYRFTIGRSKRDPNVIPQIESISTDGTRALLNDGTVINEMGAVVGSIPDLANRAMGAPRWASDSQEVCAASDAGGRLTVSVYGLNGTSRRIASMPYPAAVERPSLMFVDTSVLACDPQSNLAVVARYRYEASADKECAAPPATSCQVSFNNPVTAAIWAIRLSDGSVLLHEPDAVVANGEPFFYGSENGALAAEFLSRSSATSVSQIDTVLRIPSGNAVAGLSGAGVPNLPAVSADGTLVLYTVENARRTQLTLELVDAGDGGVIRSIGIQGSNLLPADAAAYPGGSSFMVDVDGELGVLDARGGTTMLRTTLDLGASPADLDYLGMSQAQR
jgi:hypothetical protein